MGKLNVFVDIKTLRRNKLSIKIGLFFKDLENDLQKAYSSRFVGAVFLSKHGLSDVKQLLAWFCSALLELTSYPTCKCVYFSHVLCTVQMSLLYSFSYPIVLVSIVYISFIFLVGPLHIYS